MAPPPPFVISIQSRKGGVGKTSLGLAIADELSEEGPVWFVNLDHLGTEIAELSKFALDQPKSDFPQGTLELLVQSTGANATFGGFIKRWVTSMKPEIETWPMLQFAGREHPVLFLPARRTRTPLRSSDGQRLVAESLALDVFARAQIETRVEQLIQALLEHRIGGKAVSAVILDNAPLHLGIGDAIAGLLRRAEFTRSGEPAPGKPEPGKPEVSVLRKLEVVGHDYQDMVAMCQDSAADHEKTKRWVINRDDHSAIVFDECCLKKYQATPRVTGALPHDHPHVRHVPTSKNLMSSFAKSTDGVQGHLTVSLRELNDSHTISWRQFFADQPANGGKP